MCVAIEVTSISVSGDTLVSGVTNCLRSRCAVVGWEWLVGGAAAAAGSTLLVDVAVPLGTS